MELRESPLWQEISAIAFEGPVPSAYSWKATFTAGGKEIVPFKVISVMIFRDYRNNFGDEIELEVMIPAGTFVYDLYPYRNNLKVSLQREGRLNESDSPLLSPDIEAQQMRATLVDDFSVAVEGARSSAHSRESLNLSEVMNVKFQLIDLALDNVRLHSVGGLFRDTTVGDCLKYILTSIANDIELDDNNKILGVEMVEPANTDTYKHIVLHSGTRLPDVPQILQKKVGGLYPTGMGAYLYRQHWYVFPLYDLTRFDKSVKTLTLINVPTNQMPNVERTYRTTANQVIALVTGDVKHLDRSEAVQQNEGNGVRYLDARRVIDGFADTSEGDNKAKVMRADNSNEFSVEQRADGMNNVATTQITANKFAEMSKLAQRLGSEIQCIWENSHIGAVYPGMPVKFMYIKNDSIKELKGVVLGVQHYVQTHGVGVTESRHRTDTTLHLFVEREK